MTQKLLLTIKEVAVLTGVQVGTLYHWASQSRIPCVRLSRRCLRFRYEEIVEWIDRFKVSPRDEGKEVMACLEQSDNGEPTSKEALKHKQFVT